MAFLTEADLRGLGEGLRRVYPIERITSFDTLLAAIDDADRTARIGTGMSMPNGSPSNA
ncbi:hypothetical protein [Sphingomonas sp. MMS24-J13]|uniref:hypothetical protein n=1 Tax=Sphingomonas sp. MMS24-J13 TaxID=3238686 RepID=UPI00384C085D